MARHGLGGQQSRSWPAGARQRFVVRASYRARCPRRDKTAERANFHALFFVSTHSVTMGNAGSGVSSSSFSLVHAWGVVQDLDVVAVADRDDPAVRTAGQIGVGLDVQHHQTLSTANVGIAGDVENVHALHAEQLIGPSTPRRTRTTYSDTREALS